MKKSKLLVSFASLGVLTSTLCPIASCSTQPTQFAINYKASAGGKILGTSTIFVPPDTNWANVYKPDYEFDIGYTFTGWFNNDHEMEDDEIVSSNLNITAKFDILPDSPIENFIVEGDTEYETAIIENLTSEGDNLKKVCLPTKYICDGIVCSVIGIEEDLFLNNKIVEQVVIPDSIMLIGADAFGRCKSLKYLSIGSGLKYVGDSVLYDCPKLSSIKVNKDNSIFSDGDNSNCIIRKHKQELIVGCKNTKIPDYVITIGSSAFSGAEGLEKITIPSSVKTIGTYAFSSCKSLKEIVIPDTVTIVDNSAFSGCENLSFVSIGCGVEKISYGTFRGCKSLKSITIPNNITEMGPSAFEDCSNLKQIDVSQFDDVPINWSVSNTFYNIPTTGTLYIKRGTKQAWRTYFAKAGVILNDWTVYEL